MGIGTVDKVGTRRLVPLCGHRKAVHLRRTNLLHTGVSEKSVLCILQIFFKFPDLSFLPKDVDTVQLFWDADAAFSSENWWRKINNIFVYNSPDPVWLTSKFAVERYRIVSYQLDSI